MTRYVALLRGVNVGQNMLRMERLRELCGEMGLRNVRTYLQSGNVLFDAGETATQWAKALEETLAGVTRLPVSVIVRSSAEIERVLAMNPFVVREVIDAAKLHVTFLQRPPEKNAAEKLKGIRAGADELRWNGAEIYLHCPGGYGETKLSNGAIEKLLGMRATTRNWRTVAKLGELCRDDGRSTPRNS